MFSGRRPVELKNRKARFNYEIVEKIEAGLVLKGTEVKSIRAGKLSFRDSYAAFEGNEAFLCNLYINHYDEGNRYNHDPERKRKLLLKRYQIKRLSGKVRERGLTLVPLRVYFKKGYAKVELGLGRGKTRSDQRETIRRRDLQREMARELRDR